MDYTLQQILIFITCCVGTIVGLLLIVVLVRLFEVLGLLRDILKRVIFHRNTLTDTFTQIRLFCQRYSDPEE